MNRQLNTAAGLALALTAAASPVIAQTASLSCQDKIILDCAKAMEDANYLEKVALGVMCTGLALTCNVNTVTVPVKIL